MTAEPPGPDKTFKFSFILLAVAVVLSLIGFSAGIAQIVWLGMALFWIGIILNMFAIVTRSSSK